MTAILRIDEHELAPVLLTGEDLLAMTRAGVLPEGRGHELIEGVLVKMASQYAPHVGMMSRLLRFFITGLPETYEVAAGPSVFLSDFTMLEPDVCIWPAGLKSTDVRGPDILLAVEVSDSSLRYDLGKKARLYATHGVAHYWAVDLENELIHLHTDPGDPAYGAVHTQPFGAPLPVPFKPELVLKLG